MEPEQVTSFLIEAFEKELKGVFSDSYLGSIDLKDLESECANAHRYPLASGGKRIRPLLALMTARAFGGTQTDLFAMPCALALELVHTYSLVHDDLPAMDDDAIRRGRPTSHMVFGEAKAILLGDGLLTKAFEIAGGIAYLNVETDSRRVICSSVGCEAVAILARAAGAEGMIFGQWMDISLTNCEHDSRYANWEIIKFLANKKTGCLLGAAFELGLLSAAAASEKDFSFISSQRFRDAKRLARTIGEDVGLVFQLIDDVLDVTSTAEVLGKTSGKDAKDNKLTSVSVLGIEEAIKYSEYYTKKALQGLDELALTFTIQNINDIYFDLLKATINNLLKRTF